MNSTTYQLRTLNILTTHGFMIPSLFRDQADSSYDHETLELQAEVKSGDYFVTLATRLDSLGRQLADTGTRGAIEDIVSDLIYLQDNYDINKYDK